MTKRDSELGLALGSMAVSSFTLADRVREMVRALIEVSESAAEFRRRREGGK